MNKILLSITAGFAFVLNTTLNAQTILNGDFEINTAANSCDFNLPNATFNLEMQDAFGFGPGSELDIMSYCAPYCDSAQHGTWYIALANGTGTSTDEVSLTLSSPLIAGNVYTLSYWDHGEASLAYPPTPLNIGVSLVNNSMGTIVYTSPLPIPGVWTNRIVTFTAPVNGLYLTINCDTSRWTQVDNFELLSIALVQNTCFGDTTFFTISNTNGLAGVVWNFDDINSGTDNTSTIFNPVHYFTAPGIYNVQLVEFDFNGNADTIFTTVTIYAIPIINLGNDTAYCTGTSVVLNAGGGYTSYVWQDASTDSIFTTTVSGNYFVTVSNNGCSSSDTIAIQFNPCSTPGISFAASDTNFCEKTCLDFFDLSTNNPTAWQWYFNGASPDTSTSQNPTGICYNSYGNYTVTLIACNGSGCDSLTINQFINEFQNPVDSIWITNDTLWSLPFPSYQWFEVSTGLVTGATNQYFIASIPGSYYCVVNDSIGCIATSNILVATGLNQGYLPVGDGSIVIAPNPNGGNFEIGFDLNSTLANQHAELKIVDALGRVILNRNLLSENNKFELDVPNGIYFVVVIADNKIFKQKFVLHR